MRDLIAEDQAVEVQNLRASSALMASNKKGDWVHSLIFDTGDIVIVRGRQDKILSVVVEVLPGIYQNMDQDLFDIFKKRFGKRKDST